MTFSILARCPATGDLGIATATSSPAVGGRCPAGIAGRGILTVQAVGCPELREKGTALLRGETAAAAVLAALSADDAFPTKRQVAVIDGKGHIAARTGEATVSWAGQVIGEDHVALGNVLVGPEVVEAMSAAFRASDPATPLEERLLAALEAGRDAGGQPEGQVSSCLLVYADQVGPRIDLRVDLDIEPVSALRRVYQWFRPLVPYYMERNLNPMVPRYKDWLAGNR